MNEFTPEWIEGQRKIIKDGTMTIAEMKKDFQLNRLKREAKQITCEANYPHALDEIERLQSQLSAYENDLVLLDVTDKLKKAEERIQYLENWQRKATVWSGKAVEDIEKLGKAEQRIAELEARIGAYEADDPYLCIRYQPPKDGE